MSVFDAHKPGGRYEENRFGSSAEAVLMAVQSAIESGSYRYALELADGFSQRYPQSSCTAAVYTLAAEAMYRGFGQTDDALALLERLASQYPEAVCVQQTRRWIESQRGMTAE